MNDLSKRIYDFIIETHPAPFEHIDRVSFQEQLDLSTSSIKPGSREWLKVQKLVCMLGDPHTFVSPENYNRLNIEISYISNSFYITGIEKKFTKLLGAEVCKVNGISISRIINALKPFSKVSSGGWQMFEIAELLANMDVYNYIFDTNVVSFITESFRYEASLLNSNTEMVYLSHLDWIQSFDFGNTYYRVKTFKDAKTLYFQYNRCRELQERSSLLDFKSMFLKALNNYEDIVIDLRFNYGGSTKVMEDLFNELPIDKRIFVVTSKFTDSAALLHASYLIESKEALLIGELPINKNRRYGDIKSLSFPKFGFTLNSSSKDFSDFQIDTHLYKKIPITIHNYVNKDDPLVYFMVNEK